MVVDNTGSDRVGGELRSELLHALSFVTAEAKPDGGCAVNVDLPWDVAPPFLRALMRIEAELLLQDAELVAFGTGEPRTPAERRADALVALALRATDRW